MAESAQPERKQEIPAERSRTMTSGAVDSAPDESVVGSSVFTTAYLAALLPLTLGLILLVRSSAQLSHGRIAAAVALALLAVVLLAVCGWKLAASLSWLGGTVHRNE